MNLLEKIEDILDQENCILPKKNKEVQCSNNVYFKMIEFILNLNSDLLNKEQIHEVINILEDFDIKESGNPRLANKSSVGKNQSSKKWYRENKARVKKKKEEFIRSKEGRKKLKDKEKNKGKEDRKSKYNTRVKSDRDDYEKREYGK